MPSRPSLPSTARPPLHPLIEVLWFRRLRHRERRLARHPFANVGGTTRDLNALCLALHQESHRLNVHEMKTKSVHWHISGRTFREDHLLLDGHATQIFSMVDDIAENNDADD